ncbi:MAG: hypothetical protein IKD29_10110 [Lentisphaeria bacterium]|nr:hypothetical protein [Lentisphaeria bacterium]
MWSEDKYTIKNGHFKTELLHLEYFAGTFTLDKNLLHHATVELADGSLFTLWYEHSDKDGAKLHYLNWKF